MMDFQKTIDSCVSNRVVVIVLLIFFFPLGLYCMWKGQHFSKTVRWVITALLGLWALSLLSGGDGSSYEDDEYGSCAAVIESNGCTYYRDSDCNVISRSCE
jgi:hypothetical protein